MRCNVKGLRKLNEQQTWRTYFQRWWILLEDRDEWTTKKLILFIRCIKSCKYTDCTYFVKHSLRININNFCSFCHIFPILPFSNAEWDSFWYITKQICRIQQNWGFEIFFSHFYLRLSINSTVWGYWLLVVRNVKSCYLFLY